MINSKSINIIIFIIFNLDLSNDAEVEIKLEPMSPCIELPLSPIQNQSESNKLDGQMETTPVTTLSDFKV